MDDNGVVDVMFNKFVDSCQPIKSDAQLTKLIKKRYRQTNPHYLRSSEFKELLQSTRLKIASDPKHVFIHVKDLVNELKAYKYTGIPKHVEKYQKRKLTEGSDGEPISKCARYSKHDNDVNELNSSSQHVNDNLTRQKLITTVATDAKKCKGTESGSANRIVEHKNGHTKTEQHDSSSHKIAVERTSRQFIQSNVNRIHNQKESSDNESQKTLLSRSALPFNSTDICNSQGNSGIHRTCDAIGKPLGLSHSCNSMPQIDLTCVDDYGLVEIIDGDPISMPSDSPSKTDMCASISTSKCESEAHVQQVGDDSDIEIIPDSPVPGEQPIGAESPTEYKFAAQQTSPEDITKHLNDNNNLSQATATSNLHIKDMDDDVIIIPSNEEGLIETSNRIETSTQAAGDITLNTQGAGASSSAMLSNEISKIPSTSDAKTKIGSERQIHKLENLLKEIDKAIKTLQEKELSLDDLEDENSAFLQEDSLKKRFVKVWNKLCEVKGRAKTTGRIVEKKFKFQGCRYPEISKKIEHLVNKNKIFPDFADVLKIVKKVNLKKGLLLGLRHIEQLTREIFTDLGNMLQERRQKDFVNTFGSHLTDTLRDRDDPAWYDKNLRNNLEQNRIEGKTRLEQVLNKYVEKQYEIEASGGKDEALSSDQDSINPEEHENQLDDLADEAQVDEDIIPTDLLACAEQACEMPGSSNMTINKEDTVDQCQQDSLFNHKDVDLKLQLSEEFKHKTAEAVSKKLITVKNKSNNGAAVCKIVYKTGNIINGLEDGMSIVLSDSE